MSGLLVLVVGSDGGRGPGTAIHGYSVQFPVFQIAAFMAVATASLPYLARTLQRLVEVFVVLVALASVVGGHGLPVNVLGSMAIGWGVTAIVHLVFGSPLGLPSTDDVAMLLQELGVAAVEVQLSADQEWGVARYRARLDSVATVPTRLAVSVYGRDATDAKLLSKGGSISALPRLGADPHADACATGGTRGLPHNVGWPDRGSRSSSSASGAVRALRRCSTRVPAS